MYDLIKPNENGSLFSNQTQSARPLEGVAPDHRVDASPSDTPPLGGSANQHVLDLFGHYAEGSVTGAAARPSGDGATGPNLVSSPGQVGTENQPPGHCTPDVFDVMFAKGGFGGVNCELVPSNTPDAVPLPADEEHKKDGRAGGEKGEKKTPLPPLPNRKRPVINIPNIFDTKKEEEKKPPVDEVPRKESINASDKNSCEFDPAEGHQPSTGQERSSSDASDKNICSIDDESESAQGDNASHGTGGAESVSDDGSAEQGQGGAGGNALKETAKQGLDVITDFVPGVSNIKDAISAITGKNPITGEELGAVDRVIAGISAIPLPVFKAIGSIFSKGKRVLKATERVRGIEKSIDKGESIIKKLDKAEQVIDGSKHKPRARVNKLEPHPKAEGPHTSFKRDPKSGKISGYEEYDRNGNPIKRFRGDGKPHGGVEPPFVLTPKPNKGPGATPSRARKPFPGELPKGYEQ